MIKIDYDKYNNETDLRLTMDQQILMYKSVLYKFKHGNTNGKTNKMLHQDEVKVKVMKEIKQ